MKMAEYQNIFTQVQVQGPAEMGVAMPTPCERAASEPGFRPRELCLAMRSLLVHLGPFGLVAVIGFATGFFIIGVGFGAQVDYSPAVFLRSVLAVLVRI
jgi:photosynthetic reaction center M subunit